ncbi:MAG TPA: Hsp70 family protein, partial [Candidatus Saccharimonas sp.]|nr:Hsp70 family protein [Candidatus Saccharimonas sp.]
EAEMHADEDKQKRDAAEAKNMLAQAIYQAEKMPDEFKDKISDDDKKVIEDAVKEAKTHENATSKDELEAALKALNDKIMPIGSKMYEAASKEAGAKEGAATPEADAEAKPDEPVEGEVVDEKK